MIATMSEPTEKTPKKKRPRKSYDMEDDLHNALVRRAAKLTIEWRRIVGVSDALCDILRVELAEELRELQAAEKPARRKTGHT